MNFNVYYCRDLTGTIIYIGCSGYWKGRLIAHRYRTPWWPNVAQVTFSADLNRRDALELEAREIRFHTPRHNVQHNPGAIRKTAAPAAPRRRPQRRPSYGLADAAAMVGISRSAMGRRVRAGDIHRVPHMGHRILIPHSELERVFGTADGQLRGVA